MSRSLVPLKLFVLVSGVALCAVALSGADPKPTPEAKADFAKTAQPIVAKYCLECHSTKAMKGSLDLERFTTVDLVRKEIKPWQQIIEQIEAGEMPPKDKPQPSAEEKKQLLGWIRSFLDTEAKARAGDPGHVPLRRLSNAEYDNTIRDLTGVDLKPTREFPADGAAGEGFTNAAESLSDVSPALLTKYINAAKEIAEHAVLLPDGFRLSAGKTRRDWTDESIAKLRAFYAGFPAEGPASALPVTLVTDGHNSESIGRLKQLYAANGADGRLSVAPYLLATIRNREALQAGKLDEVAAKEKLNAKYLGILWATLMDKAPSHPLDAIRARLRVATEKDSGAIAADIATWQAALWKIVPIGSYRHGDSPRQMANDPPASESQTVRFGVKPAPGQTEVVLSLRSRDLFADKPASVVWQRPRFEGPGKAPLLLKDFATYVTAFDLDYPTVFAETSKYLAAALEAAHDRKLAVADLAKKHGVDAGFLKRWIEVVAVEPLGKPTEDTILLGRAVAQAKLELLDEKAPNTSYPAINGWRKKGTDLPIVISNSSDRLENIPGTVPGRAIAVHPMPKEFVAVMWKSPIAGSVKVEARIQHAHPACGNGIAWWLEQRRGERAAVFAEGELDLGKEAKPAAKIVKVEKGDSLILAIDAKNSDHICDLTAIAITITDVEKATNIWNLSADIADNISASNPHADKLGNKDTWSFVRGPSRLLGQAQPKLIPADSFLGQWREAAADPKRKDEAEKIAMQVRSLLSGGVPTVMKSPNRVLYDNLVSVASPLLNDVDLNRFAKARPKGMEFGLPKERFGTDGNIAADTVVEIRLPAALFVGREFVVEGKVPEGSAARAVEFQVNGKSAVAANAAGSKKLLAGHDDFRRVFPLFVCFPAVVPVDEVVSLKMFHREDEPLIRLFLNDAQKKQLDRLWLEHTFISKQPTAENDYLPQFIGFVTQDQPKELLAYYEGMRPLFKKQAEDFEKQLEAAIPKQLDALIEFAHRAYRRPLAEKEQLELRALYQAIRKKGAAHDEAFRGVLARILVAPAFLFRIEKAAPGKDAGPVNDWELATRLSYFLWASAPDAELRTLAAAGKLRDPKVVAEQAERMLKDGRARALAIEFGTQWLHVRGFNEHNEKNEKLFPTFDAALKSAIYEESILFFQDLFQQNRPVAHILDADATFLNETLAKHYGIPGVTGPQFRRVEKIRQYGRGGILGLASVQTKESGASRTSPTLRGNWVSETLLGEKLPKPPPDVPKISEEEAGAKLTVRQQVEMHSKAPQCAVCHVRVDPFGFALEKYDPIGRRRDKDLGGLAVDAKAKLKDGTEFDGIDGLRNYLLEKKKDVIVRLFCRKLLGYALGRQVSLSDTALLDEMVVELNKSSGTVTTAVQMIVRSPQFRDVRGADTIEGE